MEFGCECDSDAAFSYNDSIMYTRVTTAHFAKAPKVARRLLKKNSIVYFTHGIYIRIEE